MTMENQPFEDVSPVKHGYIPFSGRVMIKVHDTEWHKGFDFPSRLQPQKINQKPHILRFVNGHLTRCVFFHMGFPIRFPMLLFVLFFHIGFSKSGKKPNCRIQVFPSSAPTADGAVAILKMPPGGSTIWVFSRVKTVMRGWCYLDKWVCEDFNLGIL